jgi:hypothetical protein
MSVGERHSLFIAYTLLSTGFTFEYCYLNDWICFSFCTGQSSFIMIFLSVCLKTWTIYNMKCNIWCNGYGVVYMLLFNSDVMISVTVGLCLPLSVYTPHFVPNVSANH